MSLFRRQFLAQAAAVSALPIISSLAQSAPAGLIDCNAHLGEHPNRDLLPVTNEFLSSRGIIESWVAPIEGLLRRDIAAVNKRHAARCGEELRAVGVIHPGLPDWQDDLKRCREDHGMKAVRLYPGYHGYELSDARFQKLLETATDQKLRVQIVAQMEDERTQHPMMRVKPVNFSPLSAVLKLVPEAKVMVLNAKAVMAQVALRGIPNLWLDIAMIEGVGGVENLLKQWPQERLVFGTHAPFFYAESSLLKLQESILTEEQLAQIGHAAAESWLSE